MNSIHALTLDLLSFRAFRAKMLVLSTSLAALPCAVDAAPFDLSDDFNDSQPSAWFSTVRGTPGYDAIETGGALRMTKQPGINSSGIYYQSAFQLIGDLSIQVDCARLSGDTSVGINVSTESGSVSVYYTTESGAKVYGSRCGPTGCSSGGVSSPPASAPFRIRRENSSRLVAEYRFNGAWQAMVLQDGATGPARVQLFMIQESGLSAQSAATFDNLRIQAPDYIDLRQSVTNALVIQRAAQICWASEINRTYQPQWRPNVGGEELWSALGGTVVGNGGTNCVFDPQGSESTRFYRVLVVP